MTIQRILLFIFCLSASFSVYADEKPPALSIVEAAQIAQEFLEKQNLPKEFFIWSLAITPNQDGTEGSRYEARFEPLIVERGRVGQEPPTTPIKFNIIVINMDGTAQIEEKIIERSIPQRQILRRKLDTQSETTE